MIDTQQQYINLNIRGEISIIVCARRSKCREWWHSFCVT
jgi:hypothetical protein